MVNAFAKYDYKKRMTSVTRLLFQLGTIKDCLLLISIVYGHSLYILHEHGCTILQFSLLKEHNDKLLTWFDFLYS